MIVPDDDMLWERMIRAVEKVQERLRRSTVALDAAGVAYAVVEDNAVAAWAATVDEAAVRTAKDVHLLLRRRDLPSASAALAHAGFIHSQVENVDIFLDDPEAKARDAVHVVFAGEKVRREDAFEAPDVAESETVGGLKVLALQALVRMKLTSFRVAAGASGRAIARTA